MIGAIAGDTAGEPYEFHNIKTKDFAFFSPRCRPTDDSAMTLAIAQALLDTDGRVEELAEAAVRRMQEVGRRNPRAGYGGRFRHWLREDTPQPYDSWGNGAAMRVSGCGWAGRTLEEALALSDAVTAVTHDHPEGIKGARATTAAIFLLRTGTPVEEVRKHIVENYYPLDFTLDGIRPDYEFDVSCQGTVPQALVAFFEAKDYEDTVRNAISIGGDSDTLACIAGAIAEARWPVPAWIRTGSEERLARFDPELPAVLAAFEKRFGGASAKEPDPSEGEVRPVVRAKLTEEAVRALTSEKVQAIALAEVGAQGESEYVLVISDEGDHVGVTSGNFGFEAFGTRYKRDLDIEIVEKVVPFLKHFLGTSPATTKRGSFSFDHGRWLHLDMGCGNHFFIRKKRFEPFRQLLANRNPRNLCMGAIDAVLDIMKKEPCGRAG